MVIQIGMHLHDNPNKTNRTRARGLLPAYRMVGSGAMPLSIGDRKLPPANVLQQFAKELLQYKRMHRIVLCWFFVVEHTSCGVRKIPKGVVSQILPEKQWISAENFKPYFDVEKRSNADLR